MNLKSFWMGSTIRFGSPNSSLLSYLVKLEERLVSTSEIFTKRENWKKSQLGGISAKFKKKGKE
ncbi:hypothetical protein E4S40_05340 [Algoriphagus kandeliae]|uniref:Uncharacterized protein n=1 Tax=Algoriphagus kandeliae TaxID=2562278 RepID=A0A4Y9QX07_9BACT|nr:hypothetical protein E4S40_05340 [Algoriphagus kandeliae]